MEQVKTFQSSSATKYVDKEVNDWLVSTGDAIEITDRQQSSAGDFHGWSITISIWYKIVKP